MQLIWWTSEVAVCGSVCVWVRSKIYSLSSIFLKLYFPFAHSLFWSLYSSRTREAVWLAWHPLVGRRSRRRRCSSVLWGPRGWASAYRAVQPRNLEFTSATWSQAPSLQKWGWRWFLPKATKYLQKVYAHKPTFSELHLKLVSTIDGRPDCGGERSGLHLYGPQRCESFSLNDNTCWSAVFPCNCLYYL